MISETHHLNLSCLWLIPMLAMALATAGIIAMNEPQVEFWRNLSIIVLVISGLVYIWHFCFEISAKVLEKSKRIASENLAIAQAEIQKMTPAYNIFLASDTQKFKCISIRPYKAFVEKSGDNLRIKECSIEVWSWLFGPITLTRIEGTLAISIGVLPASCVKFDAPIGSVVIDGLPYGAEKPLIPSIDISPSPKEDEVSAKLLHELCIAKFFATTLVTKEYGRIEPFTNVGGFIHLELDTRGSEVGQTPSESA